MGQIQKEMEIREYDISKLRIIPLQRSEVCRCPPALPPRAHMHTLDVSPLQGPFSRGSA